MAPVKKQLNKFPIRIKNNAFSNYYKNTNSKIKEKLDEIEDKKKSLFGRMASKFKKNIYMYAGLAGLATGAGVLAYNNPDIISDAYNTVKNKVVDYFSGSNKKDEESKYENIGAKYPMTKDEWAKSANLRGTRENRENFDINPGPKYPLNELDHNKEFGIMKGDFPMTREDAEKNSKFPITKDEWARSANLRGTRKNRENFDTKPGPKYPLNELDHNKEFGIMKGNFPMTRDEWEKSSNFPMTKDQWARSIKYDPININLENKILENTIKDLKKDYDRNEKIINNANQNIVGVWGKSDKEYKNIVELANKIGIPKKEIKSITSGENIENKIKNVKNAIRQKQEMLNWGILNSKQNILLNKARDDPYSL